MKKIIVASLGLVALFSVQSCTKNQQDILITQTVNARISTNETYTYALPTNVSSHDFGITSPGTGATVSAIGKDVAGTLTYTYTPAPGFTGTDHIVLSTISADENDSEGEMHDGNCNGGNHDGDNIQEGDQNNNDNNIEGDNNDGNHHDRNHHDKNREHGHQDAQKNMVININITVVPVDNTRH